MVPVRLNRRVANDSPIDVVQKQFEAFNARDLDAIMATYWENAEQVEHPSSKLLAKGALQIRERFAARFKEPNLSAVLKHRAVLGNVVADFETVSRTFPEGPGEIDLLALYEVSNGRISRAWFTFGTRRLYA